MVKPKFKAKTVKLVGKVTGKAEMPASVTKREDVVTLVARQSNPLAEKAERVVITDEKSMIEATELMSQANKILDQIEVEREKVTVPLNEALRAENGRWKPMKDLLAGIVKGLRQKASEYQTKMVNEANAEAKKIADRVGPGKGKISLETAVRKIEGIEKPVENVTGAISGSLAFKATPTLKITDMTNFLHHIANTGKFHYVEIKKSEVMNELKAGVKIVGAEIEIVQTPINSRS